jgi:hypothetical protein
MMGDAGLNTVIPLIRSNPNLHFLKLGKNNLTDRGVFNLLSNVEKNS